MKKLLLLFMFSLFVLPNHAKMIKSTSCNTTQQTTKDDEKNLLFYDENWHGVQTKEFATYERHLTYSNDPHYPNRFKDYYMDGTLQAEGTFESIDAYDDSKSVFIETQSYYRNGSVESISKRQGEKIISTYFYSNGAKKFEAEKINGKIEGIVKQYGENPDAWLETVYVNNEPDPTQQFIYAKTTDGGCVTHDFRSGKKLNIEQPTNSDFFTRMDEGRRWDGVNKNGLDIALSADYVEDYGGKNNMLTTGLKLMTGNKGTKQYIRLMVVIQNNSASPLVFDPADITFTNLTKPEKPKTLEFVSFADYTKSMDGSQKWQASYNASAERANAKEVATTSRSSSSTSARSGSQSSSNSSASLNGKSNSGFAAVGNNGAAVGGSSASINGKYNASSQSSSSSALEHRSASETVDANVYREGMKDAQKNINEFNQSLDEEREHKSNMYLKATTIAPFSTYVGYILTRETKVTSIGCDIPLEGITYPIKLKVSDLRNQ